MVEKTVWNNARRANHQNSLRMTHPLPKGNFVPKAVLMKSGIKTLNTVGQNFLKATVSVNTARPINTAYPRPTVNSARTASNVFNKAHTHVRRPFNKSTTNKNSNLKEKVNTVKGNVTIARPKVVVLDHVSRHNGASMNFKRFDYVNAQGRSKHMTGNKSYLSDYKDIDGGFVAFGGDPKGGRITSKGKISTGKLDFEDVYFVKELNFNLFSVSQMCDKKNSVLFTDTECVVLSPDFKLLDENHVLLRVPRKDNMYSVDLKNIVPSGGLTCLFAKATLDESNLWHRRLGHINFKTLNKLVRGNLVKGRKPALSFMRPFGCPSTILNTIDHLGKFNEKADEGFFVGYSTNSKTFRVFNSRTRIVKENLHVQFSENTPNITGSGPNWLFDIDVLTKSMNYKLVVTGNQSNGNAGTKVCDDAGKARMEIVFGKDYILLPMWPADPLFSQNSKSSTDAGFKPSGEDEKKVTKEPRKEGGDSSNDQKKDDNINNTNNINTASDGNNTNNVNVVSSTVNVAGIEVNDVDPKTSIELLDDPNMTELEDIVYSDDDEDVGAEADLNNLDAFILVSPIPTTRIHKDHPVEQIIGDIHSAPQTKRMTKSLTEHAMFSSVQQRTNHKDFQNCQNKKDKRGIMIKNKPRLVAQGYTQEEGIDYDEVFALVARIEAIRLFLAYASFKDFVVYQMDVKGAFLYGKIEEEVYVCQPLGFKDPDFPDRVYKVEKALYGLHQAPRVYSTKKSLCIEFEKMMHTKFQMNSMGELIFFLGLQVKQKEDGIFISQDKYVTEILKKFGFSNVKTASTPMETHKPLFKDADGEDVDEHWYRYMIGSLMYLTSSFPDIMFVVCACARFQVNPKISHLHAVKRIFRYLKGASLDRKSITGGCQFLGCRLISWQCKKQTVVANSTTEAEYVVALSCYGQVLWIQNQLLDYGYNFMHTKIYIDNESTICIVKNPVFHSKTKHIEIRHHFIKDSNEKKLIQMIKIHTDRNVAYLLTKAFDVCKFQYLIATAKDRIGVKTGNSRVNAAGHYLVLLGETGLNFADSHNMVAYLEKSIENADFAEIVDFLNVNPIRNMWHKAVESKGSRQPSEPQLTPSYAPTSHERITKWLGPGNVLYNSSLEQVGNSGITSYPASCQDWFETASKQSRNPPLTQVNTFGNREDSMEHQDDLTDFVPPTAHESPFLGGHTPGSDEGRPNINELMAICTNLSNRVLALETSKTA
ncbi:putative ribonuclease H-like domain-containing protein [Tanacetum coccineum]